MQHHEHISDFFKMVVGTITSFSLYIYSEIGAVNVPMALHDVSTIAQEIAPILSCAAAMVTIGLGIRSHRKKHRNERKN